MRRCAGCIGYGATADADPALFGMFPQAALLGRVIDRFADGRDIGAGCVLIAHSFGFKLALAIAADPPSTPLLGIDGSGTGVDYSVRPEDWPPPPIPGDINPSWGPARLYPDATFERVEASAARLGVSRSEFFARAAERWIADLEDAETTAAINAVLGDDDQDIAFVQQASSTVTQRSDW
jgi:pimeloyl-ACP methyl ester carboxylesterase